MLSVLLDSNVYDQLDIDAATCELLKVLIYSGRVQIIAGEGWRQVSHFHGIWKT
jgi:hypothetical protein